MANAYQQAQVGQALFSTQTISAGDSLFGANSSGVTLVLFLFYTINMLRVAFLNPSSALPAAKKVLLLSRGEALFVLMAKSPVRPLLLMVL